MEHRNLIIGVFVGALFLPACGPGDVETVADTSPPPETAVTESPPNTSASTEITTPPTPSETTPATSDRPIAPDFTLELGTGGTYTLSEGEKPVYLIFWAEW